MAQYLINGFILNIPDYLLNDGLRSSLDGGRYEGQELMVVNRHIIEGDRVLELGAGSGYISMQIASIIGGENLLTVEANTHMIKVIEKNMAANLVEDVTLINAAVVPDDYDKDYAEFHMTAAFWASSLNPVIAKKWKSTKTADVPAVRIGELLKEHKPSVVIMDIEGGEQGLFDTKWPKHMRLLMVELHPMLYPDHVIKQIFDQMSASGFTYCPLGSRGQVVVFKRLKSTAP